ncbi:MAG: lysine--tRNA ligase, partial [Desulfobacteraceae bacterium]|nr:lysine--tRNA ligase [Desulfobacteraceae bacterium]
MDENISKVIKLRKIKIDELKQNNIPLYPNNFNNSHSIKEIQTIIENAPESLGENGIKFSVAGRMMAVNKMG